MDINILQNAGINYAEGVERFSNHSAIYEKYLNKFLADDEFNNLCLAMQNQDYDTAFRCAHTLKGVVGNLSINGFLDKIKPFVEALRDKKDVIEAAKLFPKIIDEYNNVTDAIKTFFA